MVRRTVSLPDGLDERVRAAGERGESYSAFVQDAMRVTLEIEEVADEQGVELDEEWVREAVEQYLAENDPDAHPPKAEP